MCIVIITQEEHLYLQALQNQFINSDVDIFSRSSSSFAGFASRAVRTVKFGWEGVSTVGIFLGHWVMPVTQQFLFVCWLKLPPTAAQINTKTLDILRFLEWRSGDGGFELNRMHWYDLICIACTTLFTTYCNLSREHCALWFNMLYIFMSFAAAWQNQNSIDF